MAAVPKRHAPRDNIARALIADSGKDGADAATGTAALSAGSVHASGENQTEDSGPNGRNLRSTVDPVGSIRLILSTSAEKPPRSIRR
jgi:hypothetical protein